MQNCSNYFHQKIVRSPLDASSGGTFASKKQHSKSAKRATEGRQLGTTAKSVRHFSEKKQENRASRYRHQRHAAQLTKGKRRVGQCRHSVISRAAGVDLVSSNYKDTAGSFAHYEGLQTCGSVWHCPCCGARISETRKDELNQLLAWARAQGYKIKMITLTARHGRDDDLSELLKAMKEAKQRFARHRTYRGIKLHMVGSVTATEVTCGAANGWHPHFHMIVITDEEIDMEPLRGAWLASLRGAGLDGAGAAFQVQNAEAAGRYIGKWGAAEELTMKDQKKSKGGRTPAQLLAASCDDDDRVAGMLWSEYAEAFHGRRQLVWSRGLKAMAGIGEIDDDEAAKDEMQDEQEEVGRANIPHEVWRKDVVARKEDRRTDILDRAEDIGPDQAVAELLAGHVPDEDIFEEFHQPLPGGLAAKALALVTNPEENGEAKKDEGVAKVDALNVSFADRASAVLKQRRSEGRATLPEDRQTGSPDRCMGLGVQQPQANRRAAGEDPP